jgi:uncharacterized phage protein (TIGR01671 family)
MQDRFKFRAWNKEYSKLYSWEDIIDKKGNCSLYWCMLQAQNDEVNNILMQCTGLKDKNGKLIYEGDIVKIPDDWDIYGLFAGEKREIYFNEGGFRLKPKWDKYSHGNWLEDTKDFEVIGNIYETPELLESN